MDVMRLTVSPGLASFSVVLARQRGVVSQSMCRWTTVCTAGALSPGRLGLD